MLFPRKPSKKNHKKDQKRRCSCFNSTNISRHFQWENPNLQTFRPGAPRVELPCGCPWAHRCGYSAANLELGAGGSCTFLGGRIHTFHVCIYIYVCVYMYSYVGRSELYAIVLSAVCYCILLIHTYIYICKYV